MGEVIKANADVMLACEVITTEQWQSIHREVNDRVKVEERLFFEAMEAERQRIQALPWWRILGRFFRGW